MTVKEVRLSKRALKTLRRVPFYIADKLDDWIEGVETDGLETMRKIPGYHDEPLSGKRKGQRSIRLSIHYRVIYEIKKENVIEFVSIEEVTKHEY